MRSKKSVLISSLVIGIGLGLIFALAVLSHPSTSWPFGVLVFVVTTPIFVRLWMMIDPPEQD